MKTNEPSRGLRTTAISLRLVDHILERKGASLSELSEATGLAKSTVYTHLATLAEYGYVVNEDNRYHLGAKFCHLGDYVRTRKPYHRIAEEIVARLSEESVMEADFAVEENGRVVTLYGDLDFTNFPQFLVDGSPFHVHTTASGKAIIAQYPEARVREIVDRWGLPAATDASITSADALFEELARVREQGYAENRGEAIEGLWAIGKPVISPRGEVYGSLNLSGPLYAVDEETKGAQIELLERAVDSFEREITDLYRAPAETGEGGGQSSADAERDGGTESADTDENRERDRTEGEMGVGDDERDGRDGRDD